MGLRCLLFVAGSALERIAIVEAEEHRRDSTEPEANFCLGFGDGGDAGLTLRQWGVCGGPAPSSTGPTVWAVSCAGTMEKGSRRRGSVGTPRADHRICSAPSGAAIDDARRQLAARVVRAFPFPRPSREQNGLREGVGSGFADCAGSCSR